MIDVATIQTNQNSFETRVIIAPRKGDSVNLDACPRGTLEVHSFGSVKDAAEFMNVSASTVRRQLAQAEADNDENYALQLEREEAALDDESRPELPYREGMA